MPRHRRLAAYTGLLATLACLTLQASRAGAQDPPPSELDCGPIGVNPNDFVTFNVGNPGRAPQTPAVLLVRLLNSNGGPLLERVMTLAPGHSRTVRWPTTNGASSQILLRGEVVVLTGPSDLRVVGTIQVFEPGSTLGVIGVCGTSGGHPPRPPA